MVVNRKMNTPEKIAGKLNDHMVKNGDTGIKGWLFSFNDGRVIDLGLYNNEIGGPYAAPSADDIYEGAVYIRWSDGRVSKGVINATALDDLDAAFNEWRSASYHDPDAPDILKPLPMPTSLKIKDERVVELITKDASYGFEILTRYNKEFRKAYTKTVKGGFGAEYAHVTIMNSEGLDVGWEETTAGTSAVVNDILFDAYEKRKMPEEKDIEAIVKELDGYMIHCDNKVPIKSGKMPVILAPKILEAFLNKYLISSDGNLDGIAIANNQSSYSVEDFINKKQVFGEDINLVIDGLKDYSIGTGYCSREGVPSTKQYLIADGRLITPLLDLKYAKKTGMSPTSFGTIDLDIAQKMSYSKMTMDVDYGLVVYDVLGMHTQDSKEGKYSLTVSYGLLIENGVVKGSVSGVTIAGNFFDVLKDKKTKFADYREDELAMLTEASVTAKA